MNTVLNIVIGVAILGLLLARQMRTRPVRETSALKLFLVIGAIGLIDTFDAMEPKGHGPVSVAAIAWIIGSLFVAGGLGVIRALSVNIWRSPEGKLLCKGTAVTMSLWVIAIAIHFAFEYAIDHATTVAGLGSATILLYLAVSLGAQRETVRIRAVAYAKQEKQ